MRYTTLGTTEITVPYIGQGTMGMGGFFSRDTLNDSAFIRCMKTGIDLGMNLIDTAEVYGGGHSEELVGQAVAGIREQVLIATKFSPENSGYEQVIRAAEKSLARLNTDRIDLYQIHWPNPTVPLEETMRALVTLREQGKIRAVGVSNFSPGNLMEAGDCGETIVSDQVEYNLFDRSIEADLLPYCQKNGVTVIAYSPLDQGHIAPGGKKAETLPSIARKYGRTPSQIVLNWLINHANVIAIPKAADHDHIRQNAEAADFEIDTGDRDLIDSVFHTEPVEVPADRIKVVLDGQGNRKAYQTIDEAVENHLGFTPGPSVLADDIRARGGTIKPVRVRVSSDPSGRYAYDLVEGRIRYWAWVIAHDGKKPIPVLVR